MDENEHECFDTHPAVTDLSSLPERCPHLPPCTYPLTLCPAKIPKHSTRTGICGTQSMVLGAGMRGSRATASSCHLWVPVFLHEGMREGRDRVGSHASLFPLAREPGYLLGHWLPVLRISSCSSLHMPSYLLPNHDPVFPQRGFSSPGTPLPQPKIHSPHQQGALSFDPSLMI